MWQYRVGSVCVCDLDLPTILYNVGSLKAINLSRSPARELLTFEH